MKTLPSRSLPALGAALLALLVVVGDVQAQLMTGGITPQPICRKVPNGSFQNGFSGWTQDPCLGGFGDYNGAATATLEDLTALGCDDDVACMNISTQAIWTCDKPSGSASQAQMSLSRTAVVSGRYLKFKVIGGFEFIQYAKAHIKYDALVTVTNQDGVKVTCPVLSYNAEGLWDCGVGIAALGIIQQETICCDLFAGGISVNDTVTIEAIFSAAVVACEDCDDGTFFGSFCVDDFQFCSACLQPAPVDPVLTYSAAVPSMQVDDELTFMPGEPVAEPRILRLAEQAGVPLVEQAVRDEDD